MLDISWGELLIIGVVALIVVGPKDLPLMFRRLGEFTGRLRGMAREFQRAMDAAADEAGVKDVAREFRDVTSGRKIKDALGVDDLEREMRDLGRPDQWDKDGAKGRPAKAAADAADEADDDEAEARAHDTAMAERNARTSATEAARLKAAERSAAARTRAAELRARREAAEAAGASASPVTGAAAEPANPATARSAPDAAKASAAEAPAARRPRRGT